MTQNTMARRVGRPRGLTESRIDKRYIIAGALLAGIKIAAVAPQLGVSRSWASREANAPGTRQLLADLFELHRERMNALFDQTLDVIEDAMKARKFIVVNRAIVDVGPDHYVRFEAVKIFTLLMHHAGNGRPYIQVPGSSGLAANEPRCVPAAAVASKGQKLMSQNVPLLGPGELAPESILPRFPPRAVPFERGRCNRRSGLTDLRSSVIP